VGLPGAKFHFSTAAPAFDVTYNAVCEVEGADVHAVMRRVPSRPPGPNCAPDAASRCFAGDSLTLYGCGKQELNIHVTLDGRNILIIKRLGHTNNLLKSSCQALEKLGGTVVEPAKTRSRWPNGWREWLWTFLSIPLCLLAMLLVGLVLTIAIPMEIRSRLRERRQDGKVRSRLRSTGRFMPSSELDAKLKSGEGTLIIEHLWSKDAIREWWTEDDLVGRSPVPLPTSPILLPEEDQLTCLHKYAALCAARYTDTRIGLAKLTEVPAPELKGSRRKFAEKYPGARIVVLFRFDWESEQSLLLWR
jgi:hypothetical protein